MLAGGGIGIVALLAACASSDDSPASPAAASPADEPGSQAQVSGPAPAPSPTTDGACEGLGRLVGDALQARRTAPDVRMVSLPLTGRPVPSRVAVLGVGRELDLAGKTVALGAAANANYETCTHCLLIAIGCDATSCDGAVWFYPRSGSATFTAAGLADGEPFTGTLTDVELEEVSIDWATSTSRPVPGGACLRVQSLAFDATVSGEDGGVGGSSSGGGDEDGGDEDAGGTTSSGGTGKGSSSGALNV
jgi:hypothetical protein